MTHPAPLHSRWRYSFRSLLILLLFAPPLLSVALWRSAREIWLEWTAPPPASEAEVGISVDGYYMGGNMPDSVDDVPPSMRKLAKPATQAIP